METLINNLINGNLTQAKQQAKRFSEWAIRDALEDNGYHTHAKAVLAAAWLKGRDCWQEYCDAD